MKRPFTLPALVLLIGGCAAAEIDEDHPKIASMLEAIGRMRTHAQADGSLTSLSYYVSMAPTMSGAGVNLTGSEALDADKPDFSYEIVCSGDTIGGVEVSTVVEVLTSNDPSKCYSAMTLFVWHRGRWLDGAEWFVQAYPEQAAQMAEEWNGLLRKLFHKVPNP